VNKSIKALSGKRVVSSDFIDYNIKPKNPDLMPKGNKQVKKKGGNKRMNLNI